MWLTSEVGTGILAPVIELRVLTPDDWASWRELRLAALAEAPAAFGSRLADWQGAGDCEARWRNRLNIPDSYNVVALLHGRPVGMVSGVRTAEDDTVELISMWVSPAGRGRGVGDRLIEAVVDWARQGAARAVRLDVVESNENAIALYRRNGFRTTGDRGGLMPDGVRRENVMALALGEQAGR
jgi:ribosomal protein S18 acetylase RimI-like enzyme